MDETVLPYHSMNGALISKILNRHSDSGEDSGLHHFDHSNYQPARSRSLTGILLLIIVLVAGGLMAFYGLKDSTFFKKPPETDGFISVSPPTNAYDFSFLAPCPASGLILHGSADTVVPPVEVERVVSKLRTQKGIVIDYEVVEGASHFWSENLPAVEQHVGDYLDRRLAADPA